MKSTQKRLTLVGAIKDVGWFTTSFSTIVSGPSILALLQMVFVDHRFVDSLQWIVDGYNDIVAIIAAVFEPLLSRAVAWLNEVFAWRLTLHPHWRPLFLLMMVVVVALTRLTPKLGAAQRKLFGGAGNALVATPLMALGALVGAAAAGLAPPSAGWWAQGLAAAAPVAFTFAGVGIARLLPQNEDSGAVSHDVVMAYAIGSIWAWCAWLIGAGLSFVPGLTGAGILALGASIIFVGNGLLQYGLEERDAFRLRLALTMLGGFVTAGMIVVADLLLKLLI